MTRSALCFICGALASAAVCTLVSHYTRRQSPGDGPVAADAAGSKHQIPESKGPSAPARLKVDEVQPPEDKAQGKTSKSEDAVEDSVIKSIFKSEEMDAMAKDVRQRIESAFSELDASDGGAEAEARLVRTLSSLNPTLLLSAVHDMVRTGDAKTRMTALTALSAIYGNPSSQASMSMAGVEAVGEADGNDPSPKSDGPDAELDEEIRAKSKALAEESAGDGDESAMRIRLLVESVSECLNGDDASVKDAALETMMSLPDEASGILASQILGGDDDALKRRMLAEVGDSSDPSCLRINLQAFCGEDAAARQQASENLEKALGRRFSSAEEAAEWIEANTANPSGE